MAAFTELNIINFSRYCKYTKNLPKNRQNKGILLQFSSIIFILCELSKK